MAKSQELCEVCGKVFSSKKLLENHTRVHLQSEFKCGKCEKLFSSEEKANDHQRKVHKEKMKCEFCVFESEPGNMRRHVKAVHKGIEYECSKCSKKFKRSSTLDKHFPIYGSKKPKTHECSKCKKTFTRKGLWKKHIALQKPKLEENEGGFKCEMCE